MSAHVEARRLCELARQALKEGRLQEALTHAREAAAVEPDGEDTHVLLGIALCQNGMTSEGIDALRAAVSLNPRNTSARSNLAMAYQRGGRWDSAVAEWYEVLREEPANSRAQAALVAAEEKLKASGGQAAATAWAAPEPAGAPGAAWEPLAPSPERAAPAALGPPPVGAPPGGPQAPPAPPLGVHRPHYAGPPALVGAPDVVAVGEDTGGWSWENVMSILFQPVSFMADQRGHRAFWPPIAFFAASFAFYLLFMGLLLTIALGPAMICGLLGMLWTLVLYVFLVPVLVLGVFVDAGFVHLFVMMVRGRGGYVATFRAYAYSALPMMVTALLTGVIGVGMGRFLAMVYEHMPWFGDVLRYAGAIWMVVVLAIGLRELHDISTRAAVFAAVTPVLLTVLVVIGSQMLAARAGWTSLGSFRSTQGTGGAAGGRGTGAGADTKSSPGTKAAPGRSSSSSFRGPYMGA